LQTLRKLEEVKNEPFLLVIELFLKRRSSTFFDALTTSSGLENLLFIIAFAKIFVHSLTSQKILFSKPLLFNELASTIGIS
jgi:hypothetical protein